MEPRVSPAASGLRTPIHHRDCVSLLAMVVLLISCGQRDSLPDAPRWAEVSRDRGDLVSLDTAHLGSGSPDARSVWLRVDHASARPVAGTGQAAHQLVSHYDLDCKQLRYRVLLALFLDAAGVEFARYAPDPPVWAPFNEHPGQALMESAFRRTCERLSGVGSER
jgi:hypothetical protein